LQGQKPKKNPLLKLVEPWPSPDDLEGGYTARVAREVLPRVRLALRQR